ncbi:M12 family metallo-peptidase [Flavobacterium amniphilum]|uniref:zinc-dependent metalloprotease n=1 Tax=Flavobacterium amniphilum TaxID=1834035 RepID=UPI00202A4001|nr:zinc-dependent metalloprotease family protein [Flavobacterium amniphilum]MCL9807153.1 M12 family metallo-peptidase [Flavobacterium amniphilum]
MKRKLLLILFSVLYSIGGNSQGNKYWNQNSENRSQLKASKIAKRQSFPNEFKLFNLNSEAFKQLLYSAVSVSGKKTTIISLPNANGGIEEFEIYEASNFEPALQARFPEIRAFSGVGVTDKKATLKLSVSPLGIQTMVFRTDKENEFMEPFSEDGKVYAVFNSRRERGKLAWTCTTDDIRTFDKLSSDIQGKVSRSSGQFLRTMRLAQSCTAEYSNYFGATSVAQENLVLAAFNNTMTRCNGVYEKELALHLNLIANTTSVIYYDANTDPYSPAAQMANWNGQLQTALTNTIGDANYDIGHLFGATGGGGNAGCIGCVCDSGKGSGYTSPADGVPSGDNFDIDYVVHEVGHQLGGNHTFSHNNEGSGVNVEVGSGITIMGYAGITGHDVAPHSIDVYHAATIAQIQGNLEGKTCPVKIAVANQAPVVNAGADYLIPISTPFMLNGSATDPNGTLTYSWEQMDDGVGQTGNNSRARIAKPTGPNWVSYPAKNVPYRYMPNINSIIANLATTSGTGNEIINIEALSSVARTLNFRLTVRDNVPYSLATPSVAQTNFDDMRVTVVNTGAAFAVTSPNTAVSLVEGSNLPVTWNVSGTTANGINAAYVDIYYSNDGGLTYPILLASRVPNDGSETVTVPVSVDSGRAGTQGRVMVKGNGNIFFDISNANITTTVGGNDFAVSFNGVAGEQNKSKCQTATNDIAYTFRYDAMGSFNAVTNFSATGVPAGTTVSFSPTSLSADGTVVMTVTTSGSTPVGMHNIIVNATSGATTKTVPFYLEIFSSNFGAASLTSPANNATGMNTTVNLTWAAITSATSYNVQVAADASFTNIIASGTTSATNYSVSGLSQATNYYWRIMPKNDGCDGSFSAGNRFTTGVINCASVTNNTAQTISSSGAPTVTSTINVPAGLTINDVNLSVNITHTYVSDLTLTLTGPTGASAIVFNQSCGSGQNINAVFDDSGTALNCSGSPVVNGSVIPLNALTVFNGTSSTGTWTLTVKDNFNQDGGTLNSWGLNICDLQPSLSNPEFEMTNVRIYPNPNKGKFTLQFLSESGNNVEVKVYDLRGRQILEKSFANTGSFNQEISLDNVQSGVYLVNINDGLKKTVKRIIVE